MFDFRHRERIKTLWCADGMFARWKNFVEDGRWSHEEFIKRYSSYSFNRLVDRLSKKEREKFYELDKHDAPIDEVIPGVGFKTPYRRGNGYVYVLDMGSYADRGTYKVDPERERLEIHIGKYEGGEEPNNYLWRKASYANPRYVDRLTKKQREALLFIRMLPSAHFVPGVGGWIEYPYRPNYVIDC